MRNELMVALRHHYNLTIQSYQQKLQRRQTLGNPILNLTGQVIESQTFYYKGKLVNHFLSQNVYEMRMFIVTKVLRTVDRSTVAP